ncbi:Bacterial mobilisation domain-containing protein, partial [Dysosmobacter welbionis]
RRGGGGKHLVGGKRLVQHPGTHIGAEREAQHIHTAVGGHNGLRHRGHAHGVRAQRPGGTDLRRRFVLGAGEVHIDALAQGDGQLLRGLPGGVLESGRVHMAH